MMGNKPATRRQARNENTAPGHLTPNPGRNGRSRAWRSAIPAVLAVALPFATLSSPALSADTQANRSLFVDIGGIPVGEHPQVVEWLVPFDNGQPRCASEQHFRARDVDQRPPGTRMSLTQPGLVYKFHDNQLYEIQGTLADEPGTFDSVLAVLTARHGQPDVVENWAGSPIDSFTFQQRLRMAGWFDALTQQNLWLTGHRQGGAIVVTRNAAAQGASWRGRPGCDVSSPAGGRASIASL